MSLLKNISLILALALLCACANKLDPTQLPTEYSQQAASTQLWLDVESARSGSWHHLLNHHLLYDHLLNNGATTLDWRLRAIDSASESIDLQSFLWEFDTAGAAVSDHILAVADRGVHVRILIDDSFLYMADCYLISLRLKTQPTLTRHPSSSAMKSLRLWKRLKKISGSSRLT